MHVINKGNKHFAQLFLYEIIGILINLLLF